MHEDLHLAIAEELFVQGAGCAAEAEALLEAMNAAGEDFDERTDHGGQGEGAVEALAAVVRCMAGAGAGWGAGVSSWAVGASGAGASAPPAEPQQPPPDVLAPPWHPVPMTSAVESRISVNTLYMREFLEVRVRGPRWTLDGAYLADRHQLVPAGA